MGFALLVFASAVGMSTDHGKVITHGKPFDQKGIYYIEVTGTPYELGSDQAHAVTAKSAAKSDWKAENPEDAIPQSAFFDP